MVSSLVLTPDTILNDRYRLIEPIGEGGMATVYRALDTRLGRTVAIKILHPEYVRDKPFLQRFQQEAEFAASLGAHPNIVAIYDVGEDGDRRYIVMEFVEGRDLKVLIRDRAPFTVGEAFSIGRQVASALDFAHKRGLVHRDIKPQNILITPEGVAKVTDFGIARSITASQLTRTGMVIGTVHYFSPEQAQGKGAGPPTDIYALGIILYEMLTAHLPFEAENPIGVAMQHLHSDPPSPWDFNPGLPARAVSVVLRALEKDPNRRYRDAAEFGAALTTEAGAGRGSTTTLMPIVEEPTAERTTIFQTVEPAPPPVRQVAPQEARVVRERPLPPVRNQWRSTWIALGVLLLAAAVAGGAFFLTNHVLGSSSTATATPTPSPTATATPKKKPRKHHPTATSIPVIFNPTDTPVPFVPTSTPRPLPTWTPAPPTSTPPPPRPTATPQPVPTPTVAIVFTGPTETPTASG